MSVWNESREGEWVIIACLGSEVAELKEEDMPMV